MLSECTFTLLMHSGKKNAIHWWVAGAKTIGST